METLTGVNAMRIGREAEARRRFALAIRHDPLSPRRYLRLAGAVVPPMGRRIWLRQWDFAPETPRLLDRVRRPEDPDGPMSNLSLERDPSPGPDSLFTPWRYRENPPRSFGEESSPFWQEGLPDNDVRRHAPIYKLAARLMRANALAPVVEIGCRSGDPDDEAAWNKIASLKPQLVICANVVERVLDPRRLLSGIRRAVSEGGLALISTPDRNRQRPEAAMGPPTDPRHIREWSADEFALLLESCGFKIIDVTHRHSSMGFLVRNDFGSQPPRRDVINAAKAAPRASQV
jgi:hypothetical protein